MCTACRRNDYFGFSIILDCTEGLTEQHSLLRRLGEEGAQRFCARGGATCSASTAAGSFSCLPPYSLGLFVSRVNFIRTAVISQDEMQLALKKIRKKDHTILCFRVWDLNARQALPFLSFLSKAVYVETLKWKGCMESSLFKKLRFCKYKSWDGSVTKALCCAVAHQSQ